jgi:endoglucanase
MVSARFRLRRWLGALAVPLVVLALATAATPSADARSATRQPATAAGSNPLANLTWRTYDGPKDEVFPAYRAATGTNKKLLAKIAVRARVRWFGAWISNAQISKTVRDYITNVTAGQSNVLVQMAVFRLVPGESQACKRLPTAAERASYKQWIDRFAGAIGSTHVAMVLQPDLPVWACAPGHSPVPNQLVAYAAKKFSALAHTSVYIDSGAADWRTVAQAVPMLKAAGIRYVRGFALNATHYDSTSHNIEYGMRLVTALAAAGVHDKHFVINTSNNGRPFTFGQYHGADYNDAFTCTTTHQTRCVTLGIPPTWHVTDRRWKLSAHDRSIAAQRVDAFLWYGRSWLRDQSAPFVLKRALNMARTTPF